MNALPWVCNATVGVAATRMVGLAAVNCGFGVACVAGAHWILDAAGVAAGANWVFDIAGVATAVNCFAVATRVFGDAAARES